MEITQRIFDLLKSKHKSKAELARYLGIRPTTVTEWDTKGKKPSVEYISRISEFLGVSCDYLLTGKEHNNSTNISHSAIGAFGNHSHGTVTMNTSSTETEMKVKSDNQAEQAMSETSKELLEVFESLPMRERVKLLNMVYDFEEQYRKSNTKAQWQIAARSTDGTYESRLATPEEIEKIKLLEDAPEPEY